MLQKVLSSNQVIHTTSEPWVALHPVYALRESGHSIEFNAQWARQALRLFLKDIEGGEQTYYDGLRLMLSHIYEAALKRSEKKIFLDKTPRYYEIIPELHRIFPDAKYVLLLRNPMAVLHSRINLLPDKSGNKDLKGLSLYERDLLYGPRKIIDGMKELGHDCFALKYEDFVSRPDVELQNLCQYLEISYSTRMLEYNRGASQRFEFGDPVKVYKNKRPVATYRDKWIDCLTTSPQLWRIFSEYYEFLSDDLIKGLGYSPAKILDILDKTRPAKAKLFFTKPLSSFVRSSNGTE